MTSDRIKEIQECTAYPNSKSVQIALLQVWNECEQQKQSEIDSLTKERDACKIGLKDLVEIYIESTKEVERLREGLVMAKNYASNTNVIDAIDKVLTTH